MLMCSVLDVRSPIPKDLMVAVPERAHLSLCLGVSVWGVSVWSLPNLFALQFSGIASQSPWAKGD